MVLSCWGRAATADAVSGSMLDVSAKLEFFNSERRVILFGILQAPYGDVPTSQFS
jgi:hypothetical protein